MVRLRVEFLGSCLAAALAGLGSGCATPHYPAGASAGASSAQAEADAKVLARVKAALRSDPYFYAEHTEVTMDNGAVVLTGEVQDNRAIFDAIDAAQQAAPSRKIINHLSIIKTSPH